MMTSTIDELSRRRDEAVDVQKFTPSSSNPYLSISKHFGVDYGDTLLYADVYRDPTAYSNDEHEQAAHERIVLALSPINMRDFHTLVVAQIKIRNGILHE